MFVNEPSKEVEGDSQQMSMIELKALQYSDDPHF